MNTVTYYKHDIEYDEEYDAWTFALSGWIHVADTLEEAKKVIRENWRESLYFYKHCC